jgi:hypothetical protein
MWVEPSQLPELLLFFLATTSMDKSALSISQADSTSRVLGILVDKSVFSYEKLSVVIAVAVKNVELIWKNSLWRKIIGWDNLLSSTTSRIFEKVQGLFEHCKLDSRNTNIIQNFVQSWKLFFVRILSDHYVCFRVWTVRPMGRYGSILQSFPFLLMDLYENLFLFLMKLCVRLQDYYKRRAINLVLISWGDKLYRMDYMDLVLWMVIVLFWGKDKSNKFSRPSDLIIEI